MKQVDAQEIEKIARKSRAFLVDLWPHWHRRRGRPLPSPLSIGTCQTSSLFLASVLQKEGFAAVVIQGNDPLRKEGYFHDNVWHGHAWVELCGYLIDITGDQFDLPAVHVEKGRSSRYQAGIDTAGIEARSQRKELVDTALLTWKSVV